MWIAVWDWMPLKIHNLDRFWINIAFFLALCLSFPIHRWEIRFCLTFFFYFESYFFEVILKIPQPLTLKFLFALKIYQKLFMLYFNLKQLSLIWNDKKMRVPFNFIEKIHFYDFMPFLIKIALCPKTFHVSPFN